MPKQGLSKEQEFIINQWLNDECPILVKASAGSGKTRILTEGVRRIFEKDPKGKSKILCITFTNKAADEMQFRLSDLIRMKERVFIGTIHSFALDIIKSKKRELGLDEMPSIIDKESDRKMLVSQVILSNPTLLKFYFSPTDNKSLENHQNQLLNQCINFIRNRKQELIWFNNGNEQMNGEHWNTNRIQLFKDYNTLLNNQNLIDYDDIILYAWKILTDRPAVANLYGRIYEYILIDEAQDLNFAQYEFIKTLCSDKIRKIIMVGDPNQTIHGYAGASSMYMENYFVNDFLLKEHQIKKIQYNYRSSKAITDLAYKLTGVSQDNDNISFFDGQINFLEFESEIDEAKWVISKVHELIDVDSPEYDGELTLDKIAVLGRNKFVFNTLASELNNDKKLKDHFYLKKGTSVLESQSTTMKIFDIGIRLISNPRAIFYYEQLTELLDVNEKIDYLSYEETSILEKILSKSKLNYIPTSLFDFIFQGWKYLKQNINQFPHVLTSIRKAVNSLSELNEKNLALYDIDEWSQVWDQYIRSVSAKSHTISDFIRYHSMGLNQTLSHKGLTLATVHSVKGLEYYVVFLIGMGQGTFPDYRALKNESIEEEKNNLYVAVTRAKRDLYITYPKSKSVPWGTIIQQKSEFFKTKKFNHVSSLP